MQGICRLTLKTCELDDSGPYYCKIDKQKDETGTKLDVVGKCTYIPKINCNGQIII